MIATAIFSACWKSSETMDNGYNKGTISPDICKEFSVDFVYSATGKPIVRAEPSPIAGIFRCEYFINYQTDYYKSDERTSPGGQYISIQLENNLSIANQKKWMEALGRTIKVDPNIKMDNFIAVQENGEINTIYLILSPMSFISIDRSDTKVISNEENIAFAAKVAEKINGKLSFKIETNPVSIITDEGKTTAIEPSQEKLVKEFFSFLGDKNSNEALAMINQNENTKKLREINFNTIQSLKIRKIEPVFQEEWTTDRQRFKVDLDIKVNSEWKQYGWNQWTNLRRVTIEKIDGKRMIHELANNP